MEPLSEVLKAVFVGRERELAFLERRLAEALMGDGGVVLVEGEAGAGKTALAHALTRNARAQGVRTAWGACVEEAGPYRPWAQILRSLGLPQLDRTGDSRPRSFDEVAETIHAATGSGLLLVIDDLHWADPSSLALLQVVAAEAADGPLLLVGLYRGPEPSAAVRSVLRERASSHIALGGLSRAEIGRLAAWALGHDLDDSAVTSLRNRSGGNPLFVLELLRLMEATGQAETGLPRGVREVIEERAARLSGRASRALCHATVLGGEFSLAEFTALTGEPPDVLDEAIYAGLLRINGRAARFSHALVQEVLYARLSTAERQRLHALAARAVEPSGTTEALAHHLRHAGEYERALAATLEAARQASARLAYEHAALQYREALALPGAAPRRAELLLELARCQLRSGDVEGAWERCREAADLGRASGDARIVADAATVPRGIENYTFSQVTTQIHALCRQALAMLDGSDPVRHARLLGQLAITADPWAGDAETDLGERALAAAETTGDSDALLLALQARHTELINSRHVRTRLELGERAVRLGRASPECALWGRSWRMDAFAELGERVPFDAELAAFTNLVEQAREPLWRWRWTLIRASLACVEGRFEESRALAREALAIGRRCRHEGADFLDLVFTAHDATLTGEGLAEVEPQIRRFTEQGPFFARAWLALILAHMGRLDEASRIWHGLVPHLDRVPVQAVEWLTFAIGNAELLALLGETTGAADTYATLLPFAGRQAMGPAHTPWGGPVTLSLGRLALLLEDWPAAEDHLNSALAESRAINSPPYQALTHLELARLGHLRRAPGDLRAAAAHREIAHAEAERLGMPTLAARAKALRATRTDQSGPLSAREQQVTALIAEGLTNRQIAARLHLSERTVENHVSHIFDKLGVNNRTLIASWHNAHSKDRATP